MTGGKARQKRNGPGGSGYFHAFCYFLARTAQTWCGGGRPARTWCTIPRKTLFLRSLCTKSGSLFGDRPVSFHKNTLPQKEGVFNSYGESIRLRRASGFSRRPNSVQISCYSLPRPLPRPATRRSTSVSFISSDTIMPSISSSFSTSSSGKRFRIRWQTMLM